MNVEKLFTVAEKLNKILETSKIQEVFEQVIQSLEQRVNDPGNASHQQSFSDAYDRLRDAAKKYNSEAFDPIEYDILDELSATDALPDTIFRAVERQLSHNPHTINAALKAIKEYKENFDTDLKAINDVISALNWFNVEKYTIETNTGQILFQIPRTEIEDRIDLLEKEISHLDRLTASFSEFAYKKRERARVAYLSSTEPIIVVVVGALAFKYVAEGISKIVESYAKLQELENSVSNIKQTMPENITKPMQEHLDSMIKSSIDQFVDSRIKGTGSQLPSGRINELRIEIKKHLREVAKRIDRGYRYQLAIGKIDDSSLEEGRTISDQEKSEIKHSVGIVSKFKKIGAPLLKLEDKEIKENGDVDEKPD